MTKNGTILIVFAWAMEIVGIAGEIINSLYMTFDKDLELAPSAGIAFAVVMRAVSDAAAEWASSLTSEDADLDSITTICGTTVH